MSSANSHISIPKKLLIITSSGGGGLLQAANAKEQDARALDPKVSVVRIDVLRDWMGKRFGAYCSERWNRAQIKGDIPALRFLIASQFLFDQLCWPYFFIRALILLFKENPDRVVDTQPIGTSAILKALRIYNFRLNKKVVLEKILVDLPTKAATHFFRPIKGLTKNDRHFLQLKTIAPLLEDGQTPEDFWRKNCRLSEKEVCYEDVNVRRSFRKYQGKIRDESAFSVFIRFKSDEELKLIKKTLEKGTLKGKVSGDEIHFSIAPKDHLITILLGSQPASEATLNYVKKFSLIAKEDNFTNQPCHLFVFCSEHQPHQQSLFKKVADYVHGCKKWPENFTIVPFSFQNDDAIAPLFFRSDLTCTRSGGQTAMELMCVSSGEMWIHSETKKKPEQKEDLSLEQLLEGIPGWESANALYLKKVCNAKIIAPEILGPYARKLFRTDKNTAHSTPVPVSTI